MHKLQLFPNAKEIQFKPAFAQRYSKLTDWETYKKYSLSFLRKSIRINTLKSSIEEVKKRLINWEFTQIPWCKEGFWVEHKKGRLDIGNTVEHSLGYYYVQEAASMIPPIVLEPKKEDLILDLCASPGSKTTQIGQLMNNTGIIIANDISGERLAALGTNIQRIGLTNCIITQQKGEYFKSFSFDKILVDAPCSGTGTIRKSPGTLKIWNPIMITRLAGLQKKILANSFSLLKPKGILVYSTCSNEPEENEGVVDFLLSQESTASLEKITLDIKGSKPVEEFEGQKYNPEIKNCLRLWPQDEDTEGFFVAKFVKKK
ncbi:RsmB/NOP family class I SAM-dependent RNA methyltransferase [Candidatus Woesearchaeota archaeon]|nr:RsmB/NOP family class I SAM-dependent RNA methyltransferase [Candidatus Woesearchaeota archaeon]